MIEKIARPSIVLVRGIYYAQYYKDSRIARKSTGQTTREEAEKWTEEYFKDAPVRKRKMSKGYIYPSGKRWLLQLPCGYRKRFPTKTEAEEMKKIKGY